MIKILFVCHGNICRSPMAEFLFRKYVTERGLQKEIYIESAATSREEIGNPVHPGTRRVLKQVGIDPAGKTARQMTGADYREFDYLIAMDQMNIRNMMRILKSDPQHKIFRMLDLSDRPRDIADPWYTGNFDETYQDMIEGCEYWMEKLLTELSN